jgi:hypothetical protein
VYVGLFSLARTKLPSYITPCYPGLALLVGSYVDRWSRDAATIPRWWLPLAFGVLALAGGAFAVAIPQVAEKYLPGEEWLGLLGLTPLAGGVACIGLAFVRNFRAAAAAFAGSAVAFSTLLFAVGAQRADHHQNSHVILRTIFEHSDNPTIASYKILEPSWVFYAGRPIRELPRGGSTIRIELEPGYVQTHNLSAATQFFLTNSEAFLITTREHFQEIGPLPRGVRVLAETDLFLKGEQLVLLGHERPAVAVEQGDDRLPPNGPWK